MTQLETLNELIDYAKAIAGSDYAIAKQLGVPRGHVSAWRHGQRTATPEDQALLAGIAGLDATTWLARATIAKHEGTAKGDRLLKVLGKTLGATIAATASSGAVAETIFDAAASHLAPMWSILASTMYIMYS